MLMVFQTGRAFLCSLLAIFFVALTSCEKSSTSDNKSSEYILLDTAISNLHAIADTGFASSTSYIYKKLDSIELVCANAGYTEGVANVVFIKGSIQRLNRNYSAAIDSCQRAYNMVAGKNSPVEISILLEMADIYKSTNKKILANENYYKAYNLAEKLGDLQQQAFVAGRLGTIFYHQNNYDMAMHNYKLSIRLIKTLKLNSEHNTKHLQLYNNIALCYVNKKLLDTALIYYDSALKASLIIEKSMNEIATGVVLGNIGRVHQLKGDYNTALQYLKKNIAINTLPGKDNGDAVTSYTYMLEIYNQLDSNAAFMKTIGEAEKLVKQAKGFNIQKWNARIMGIKADFVTKTGDYKKALEYRNLQLAISDSFQQAAETETLQDLIFSRRIMEQNELVKLLEKDNRLQQSKIATYLAVAILGIVLLIAAVVGLNSYRYSLKEQQQLNIQIARQNEEISLNKFELEQAVEELKTLDAEKNRLLGMVAHDLRGPIYNISGVVSLIEAGVGYEKMAADDVHLIELIKKSCDNALDVINDLLEAARMDAVGIEITKAPENLNQLLQNAIALYQNQAQQKGIQIVVAPPTQEVILQVNKEKMSRAIGNLLSNAIKFSYPGDNIHIVLAQTNNSALISIADKGMGIPDSHKNILFDKFTRAKRDGTAGEKPIGLGMSIVKQIIEAHHGRLWFESEVNQGTTFYIELPMG